MELKDVIDQKLISTITNKNVIGIDIGSRTGKAVLLSGGKLYTSKEYTGINMQITANALLTELLQEANLERSDISYIVGTGYGRVALKFNDIPNQIVTEISCHSLGAHYLNSNVRTIVDIGGQDSKVIKVNPENGKVDEFLMNDKCAAGTGRFLEKVAGLLDLTITELGEKSVKSTKPSEISSQCVVFAESEIISLRAKGETQEDIAAGIHLATASRVRNLLSRINITPDLVFTGGVSNNIGMRKALEDLLGYKISEIKLDTIYAGALGAAIHAQKFLAEGVGLEEAVGKSHRPDLTELESKIVKYQEDLISGKIDTKKVGYLCTYTPLELINAAGVSSIRLFKSGDTEIVASGEQITQSVFCDFTKSILGAFKEGDPLYKSLDKVYTFYTCDCIKKVGEAINDFFVDTDIYVLPRLKGKESSRDFYRDQILDFKEDLEKLSGNKISEEEVKKQIVLYNKIRTLLKQISELRKRSNPPLTGKDFIDLLKAYYYLPPKELLITYEEIYKKLSAVPDEGERKIRLYMAGGIIADGDRRLLELIEDVIGARVVVEDHCTGLRSVYNNISEDGDPYTALAESYIDRAPCTRMKPLEESVEFSGQLAKEYDVDAVLYVYLKFCPCYGQVKNEFFRHFQKLGLPILEIPIDYSQSDEGQLKTRLEAFIEVLKERKGEVNAISSVVR